MHRGEISISDIFGYFFWFTAYNLQTPVINENWAEKNVSDAVKVDLRHW